MSDNPYTRVNPVSKCGIAAQDRSLRFFGVTLGYCISGSNLLSDYTYVQSRLCRDGKGSYSQGFFVMDVYEVTNQQSFMDSVVGIPEETTTDGDTGSGSGSGAKAGAVYSAVSILTAMFLGLITFL